MSKKSKTTLIVSLLILAVILIILVPSIVGKLTILNEGKQISTTPTQPMQPQKLPHPLKQALVEDIKKLGESKYKIHTLFEGDTEKFIEPYREDHFAPGYTPTPPEKVEDYGLGGILVMEKQGKEIRYLWNSLFNIGEMPARIEVRDINNDGVKEVLSFWKTGTRMDDVLWIFQYDKKSKKFNLISPLRSGGKLIVPDEFNKRILSYSEITHFGTEFGGQGIKVEDLDGDKIEEVKILDLLDYRQDTPNEVEYPHTKNVRIYKWGIEKFYFWKEETSENTGLTEGW